MIAHKVCLTCDISKPLDCFSALKKGGELARCKPCRAIEAKKYRRENPKKVKEMKARYYAQNVEKILAQKAEYYSEVVKPRNKAKQETQNEDSLHHRSSGFNWFASLWRVFRDWTVYRILPIFHSNST